MFLCIHQFLPISIHALLAESDQQPRYQHGQCRKISIHALLAESDRRVVEISIRRTEFQSTLSLRRATDTVMARGSGGLISIHALLAESDWRYRSGQWFSQPISIHALLAESDPLAVNSLIRAFVFQSTLSLRRATWSPRPDGRGLHISIHALLAESDVPKPLHNVSADNFNPRSPCGERPLIGAGRMGC